MAETTQINKFRQKRLRNTANKSSSYFYPKNNLYTRQEFELLDSIYSDEPSSTTMKAKQETIPEDNFWPQDKEKYLSTLKRSNSFLKNLSWFTSGVVLASAVWFTYHQVTVHQIKIKNDTQIVFQESPHLLTDKTADKEVTSMLEKQRNKEAEKQRKEILGLPKISFSKLFKQKPKETPTVPAPVQTVKYHTVADGDSIWSIANKYYSNPSPENINKIMKANNMKRVGILSIGQKLVIP